MPFTLRRIRWWWLVGFGWLAGYALLWWIGGGRWGMRRWAFGDPSRAGLILALLPVLVGVAWLVVVAPILDARSTSFSERRTAVRRGRVHAVLAWTPTVLFGLLLVQFAIVRFAGLLDHGWFGGGYGWWLGGAFALSLVYAPMIRRRLDATLRAAAQRAGVCYRCNYDLAGLTGDRCPECGAKR